jgi:hypothetical protein
MKIVGCMDITQESKGKDIPNVNANPYTLMKILYRISKQKCFRMNHLESDK